MAYWFTLYVCERVAADDIDSVVLIREPEGCARELIPPRRLLRLVRFIIKASPGDVHPHPSLGVGHGYVGHLERPAERPVGAVDKTAVEAEAFVDRALIADPEWVRDVDFAASRFAACGLVRRRDVGGGGCG